MRGRLLRRLAAATIVATALASTATLAFRSGDTAAAPAAAAPGAKRFGLSLVGLGYPFASAIARGFTEAAAARGVVPIILDARGDVQRQANDIQDLIQLGVDGIVLMPLDSVVAQSWVRHANRAEIPVVAVGSLVGDPRTRGVRDVHPGLAALVTQDEVEAGFQAGRLALSLLPRDRTARIAIVEGAAGFPEVEQRSRGFLKALDESGLRYTIVSSQPGNWSSEKGEATCQNILAAEPRIDLFYNQADDMVIGCARAVRAAGSPAKLIGVGGSKLGIAWIAAGEVEGTVCYKPEALGALAFQSLLESVSGTPVEPRFRTYPLVPVTRATTERCIGQW